jgi:hypothetical protein
MVTSDVLGWAQGLPSQARVPGLNCALAELLTQEIPKPGLEAFDSSGDVIEMRASLQ